MNTEESVEISALSVDEAILIGLTRLAATRDEVDITILDEGSRGFLGLGTRMASVRLSLKAPLTEDITSTTSDTKPNKLEKSMNDNQPIASPDVESPMTAEKKPDIPATQEMSSQSPVAKLGDNDQPQTEVASDFVNDSGNSLTQSVEEAVRLTADHLLSSLSIQLTTEWRSEENRPTLWVSIKGSDAKSIIGPRAQTLNAVQYLFRTLVHRQVDGNYDLVIDADGYRMRRRRSLENLARNNADNAIQSGQTVRLRSMPAHERRLIHMILREDKRVETRSVGTGRDRAITIIPKSLSDT